MLDRYRGGYNDTQASAVAHLMRYIGQSERMDYSSSSSGTGSYDIWQTIRRFGYDPDAMLLSKDSWWGDENYDDEEWGMLIQEELLSHRPVLMCAYTPTWSGHAFNIDGYDASDDTSGAGAALATPTMRSTPSGAVVRSSTSTSRFSSALSRRLPFPPSRPGRRD